MELISLIRVEDRLPKLGQFVTVHSIINGRSVRVPITAYRKGNDWYGVNWVASQKLPSPITH
jgi:hypothetical protein